MAVVFLRPCSPRHNQELALNRLLQWRDQLRKSQGRRDLKLDFRTVAAGLLCLVSAAISSAGGVGGGALFLPILNLAAGLSLKSATTFSAFMVTGGAASNVLYNACFSARSPIDYDIALLSEPAMLLGVTAGVVCHVVFPEWLVMVLFVILLAWSSHKTCSAAVAVWEAETAAAARSGGLCDVDSCGVERNIDGEQMGGSGTQWKKILSLAVIWLAFFVLQFLRRDKSVTGIRRCGVKYWTITLSQVPLSAIFTAWVFYVKGDHATREYPLQESLQGTRTAGGRLPKLIFPAAALLSGILGGLFGIGGGMLMNPVLLHLGIPPETTAPTSSFIVLFSSSMSAVQYLMLGMHSKAQAAALAAGCFASSLAGLVLVQRAVGRLGRASLIVFSVSTVMVCSMVSMGCFGVIDVWGKLTEGESMGFKPLCKAL